MSRARLVVRISRPFICKMIGDSTSLLTRWTLDKVNLKLHAKLFILIELTDGSLQTSQLNKTLTEHLTFLQYYIVYREIHYHMSAFTLAYARFDQIQCF